ncbi:MAG: SpoIID/LytB domain-containing protein [Actinobacteria bacterium]|nr:SpoIID/LytB domain-containing protein [Actinomycetota bacterium]
MTRTPHRLLVLTLGLLLAAPVPAAAAADDPPTCRGQAATIVGTDGDDVLTGTNGPDVIVALGGNDIIRARGGDDVVCAGDGDDTVVGSTGVDVVDGEDGNDRLKGNDGDDRLFGGPGDDLLRGGDGDDTLKGGSGADRIIGDDGDDTLVGQPGDDDLSGNADADVLLAGSGDDTLDGGTGPDVLQGGRGGDLLEGGGGDDELWGEAHPDLLDGGPGDDVVWELRAEDTHLAEGDPDAEGDVFAFTEIQVTPDGGWMLWKPTPTALEQGHEGVLTVTNLPDGLLMVERIDPERYLLGIAEMPYSWEPAALQSQAIAARTYLASLVSNPRYGPMAEYGFDICDWSLCQVYKGTKYGWLEPWEDAVVATTGLIVRYDGQPASTFYHSTSGPTTRSIQDVWTSSPALPYLQAVAVPEQDSPFATWWYLLPIDLLVDVLEDEGGVDLDGQVTKVRTFVTEPGDGPYTVRIRTTEGVTDLPVSTVQQALNSRLRAELLYPAGQARPLQDALPPLLGLTLKQAILSPTFDMKLRSDGQVRVRGYGWGHQIGLSQYGANAMAVLGSTAAEILGHFYTGLVPEPDPGLIPGFIDVGLFYENGSQPITLTAQAGYEIRSGGALVRSGDGEAITITRLGDDAVAVHFGP